MNNQRNHFGALAEQPTPPPPKKDPRIPITRNKIAKVTDKHQKEKWQELTQHFLRYAFGLTSRVTAEEPNGEANKYEICWNGIEGREGLLERIS